MSFTTDIRYLMTADTSLNSYCDGGLYYENLPENFDLTDTWIVYSFNKSSQVSCLGSTAALTEYNLTVKIISPSTITLETVSDYIVSYLNGESYGGIGDITFIGDNHSLDLVKKIYMNTLQFVILYL